MTARVAVLTPPGSGAIAVVSVAGPDAWAAAKTLFQRPLPASPEPHRFWYGRLGDGAGDEVVLAVKATDPPAVEVHCHGGRRVVRWVVEQFLALGCVEEEDSKPGDGDPWALLERATTLRTAGILLDQCHGAFARAVADSLAALDRGDPSPLHALAARAELGRHLVTPWRVVIGGAPNVGKSSLVNALAGYQRSVVSPVAGTTRDVVTVPTAFDGWPVELADTAGLRAAADPLEAEGVGLAERSLGAADLVVWVLDGTDPNPVPPPTGVVNCFRPSLVVVNKADRPAAFDPGRRLMLSAATGLGIPELIAGIARALVPDPPPAGAAVPFTAELADAVATANHHALYGRFAEARATLARCG